MPESVIMEITGHSRGKVIDRYNPIGLEDMREAVERVTQYRNGLRSTKNAQPRK